METTPLRRVRQAQQKTLSEVALAVGTTKGHLSIVETNGAGASPDLAARLVNYFGRDSICEMEILYPGRAKNHGNNQAELQLLDCFRRMRTGQQGVMLELAVTMISNRPTSEW